MPAADPIHAELAFIGLGVGVDLIFILAAGVAAGLVNAVAGGGTLLSFPVLLWAGRDPVVANATNALALWPGSIAAAWGFRRELAAAPGSGRLMRVLIPPAMVGGLAGGALLLATPSRLFASIVPWLILVATALVALQRPMQRILRVDATRAAGPAATAALFGAQLVVSIYGGYFGAGMGIIMLAALGLYGVGDILLRNGLKNVLAAVINGVAGVYFIASGAIDWRDAGALAVGSILGGLVGAAIGRRVGRRVVEIVVVVIGLGMALGLLARGPSGGQPASSASGRVP